MVYDSYVFLPLGLSSKHVSSVVARPCHFKIHLTQAYKISAKCVVYAYIYCLIKMTMPSQNMLYIWYIALLISLVYCLDKCLVLLPCKATSNSTHFCITFRPNAYIYIYSLYRFCLSIMLCRANIWYVYIVYILFACIDIILCVFC